MSTSTSPPKRRKSVTPSTSKDAKYTEPTSPPPQPKFEDRKPNKPEEEKKPNKPEEEKKKPEEEKKQIKSEEDKKSQSNGDTKKDLGEILEEAFTGRQPVPAVQDAQSLLRTAEENIRNDLETYKRLVPEKATTSVTLWHLTDRTFEHFWKRVLLKQDEFAEKFREIYTNNPEKLDARFNSNSAEDKDILRHFDELKHASTSLEKFQNPPPTRDHYEVKRITQELVDTCSDVTQVVNVPLDLVGKIARLKKLCEKSVYTIGVFGLEKAGKTTFCNYLIGYDLLPTAKERCTMVPTVIRGHKDTTIAVTVEFYSSEEFESTLSSQHLRDEVREKAQADFKSLAGKSEITITGGFDKMKGELRSWVADESKVYSIKRVIVSTDQFKTDVPIEIHDIPGFDSVISAHRKMAEKALEQVDAIIFMASGYKPSTTEPQQTLIEQFSHLGGYNMIQTKSFVIITNIDAITTTADGEQCIKIATKDLLKIGFLEKNIFVACPALDLFEISKNLSQNDANSMKTLQVRVKTIHPRLNNGTKRARDAVYAFIRDELPIARWNEAAAIASELRKNVRLTIEEMKRNSVVAAHANESRDKDVEKTRRHQSLWSSAWTEAIENANTYRFIQIGAKKNEIFEEMIGKFGQEFKKNCNKPRTQCEGLLAKAPKQRVILGGVDHIMIELTERERLVLEHLQQIEDTTEVIANSIYRKLTEYYQEVTNTLYSTDTEDDPEINSMLDEIYPYATCKAEVKSLIMRTAFPLLVACVKWPRDHEQRKHALEELYSACPELKTDEDLQI